MVWHDIIPSFPLEIKYLHPIQCTSLKFFASDSSFFRSGLIVVFLLGGFGLVGVSVASVALVEICHICSAIGLSFRLLRSVIFIVPLVSKVELLVS